MHGGESFCEFSDVGPIEVLDHYSGLGSWRHLHSSSNYGELNSRFPCHRAKFHPTRNSQAVSPLDEGAPS